MALYFRKYKYSILGFMAFLAFVVVPDLSMAWLNSSLAATLSFKNLIIAALIAFFVSFSASKKTIVVIASLCVVMQATQLLHLYGQGSFYAGTEIASIISEPREVLLAPAASIGVWWLILAVSVIAYLLALAVYLLTFKKTKKIPYLSVLFVIALSVPFLQALSHDSASKFEPNPEHLSIKNGLYALSYFTAKEVKGLFALSQAQVDDFSAPKSGRH